MNSIKWLHFCMRIGTRLYVNGFQLFGGILTVWGDCELKTPYVIFANRSLSESSPESWALLFPLWNDHHCWWNYVYVAQVEMFHVIFSHVRKLPSSILQLHFLWSYSVRRLNEWETLCNHELNYRLLWDWTQINTMYNKGPVTFFNTLM